MYVCVIAILRQLVLATAVVVVNKARRGLPAPWQVKVQEAGSQAVSVDKSFLLLWWSWLSNILCETLPRLCFLLLYALPNTYIENLLWKGITWVLKVMDFLWKSGDKGNPYQMDLLWRSSVRSKTVPAPLGVGVGSRTEWELRWSRLIRIYLRVLGGCEALLAGCRTVLLSVVLQGRKLPKIHRVYLVHSSRVQYLTAGKSPSWGLR